MTNDTFVKSSISPQAYKVVITHDHEISVWTIISRLLHSRAPSLGGVNGGVWSDLATLSFNNGEQLEDFRSIILILQQYINLSGETVSPTRLLFHYMKALSKSDKIKAFIVPKMKKVITVPYNNEKSNVYTGGNIHGLYPYLEIIGAPTTLTTSVQYSHHFSPSYSIKNDTAYLQTVIADLRLR